MTPGCCWAAAASTTVSVAALVVAEPTTLVNVASYSCLFSAAVMSVTVSVSDVAPAIGFHVLPTVRRADHCTVGVGVRWPSL